MLRSFSCIAHELYECQKDVLQTFLTDLVSATRFHIDSFVQCSNEDDVRKKEAIVCNLVTCVLEWAIACEKFFMIEPELYNAVLECLRAGECCGENRGHRACRSRSVETHEVALDSAGQSLSVSCNVLGLQLA